MYLCCINSLTDVNVYKGESMSEFLVLFVSGSKLSRGRRRRRSWCNDLAVSVTYLGALRLLIDVPRERGDG